MPSDLDTALTVNQRAVARLREREAALAAEAESVRQMINSLEVAAETIRHVLGEPASTALPVPADVAIATSGATDGDQPLRARIGEQRYLMLIALREFGALSEGDIAEATQLTPKRVRDQMRSDLDKKVVAEQGDKLVLTEVGGDLLERFEQYRRETGQELWSLPIDATHAEGGDPPDERPDTTLTEQLGEPVGPSEGEYSLMGEVA